jgi:hypothetical protein
MAHGAREQVRVNHVGKLEDVSSQWNNIPSNFPKEVLKHMLNFQTPQSVPINRREGTNGKVWGRGINVVS